MKRQQSLSPVTLPFKKRCLNDSSIICEEPYVYYRSDTRDPSEIFKSGFTPRVGHKNFSWARALKADETFDDKGNRNIRYSAPLTSAVDADAAEVVCMSTHFNSAAYFPLLTNAKESWIYVVTMPAPIQIEYDGQSNSLNLDKLLSLTEPTVLDFHSLQAQQTAYILKNNSLATTIDVGLFLCGYESLSNHVPVGNIFGAMKISRDNLCLTSNDLKFNFQVTSDVLKNLYYSAAKPIYTNKLLEHLQTLTMKEHSTPSIYHGLGGKTFGLFNYKLSKSHSSLERSQSIPVLLDNYLKGDKTAIYYLAMAFYYCDARKKNYPAAMICLFITADERQHDYKYLSKITYQLLNLIAKENNVDGISKQEVSQLSLEELHKTIQSLKVAFKKTTTLDVDIEAIKILPACNWDDNAPALFGEKLKLDFS